MWRNYIISSFETFTCGILYGIVHVRCIRWAHRDPHWSCGHLSPHDQFNVKPRKELFWVIGRVTPQNRAIYSSWYNATYIYIMLYICCKLVAEDTTRQAIWPRQENQCWMNPVKPSEWWPCRSKWNELVSHTKRMRSCCFDSPLKAPSPILQRSPRPSHHGLNRKGPMEVIWDPSWSHDPYWSHIKA